MGLIFIVVIAFCIALFTKRHRSIAHNILEKLLKIKFDPTTFGIGKECAICTKAYEKEDQIITLPCDPRHYFHEECIKVWLQQNAICPICRAKVDENALGNAKAKSIEEVIAFMKRVHHGDENI